MDIFVKIFFAVFLFFPVVFFNRSVHCAKLRKRLCPYCLGIGAMRAVMDIGMSTIVYLLSSICISYDRQQFICFTYIIMGGMSMCL